MKNGNLTMLIGETRVGPSEMPGALEAHVRSMFADRPVVVLNCVEHGVPAGLDGRLIGHPNGYVGYQPPEGVVAEMTLANFDVVSNMHEPVDGDTLKAELRRRLPKHLTDRLSQVILFDDPTRVQ